MYMGANISDPPPPKGGGLHTEASSPSRGRSLLWNPELLGHRALPVPVLSPRRLKAAVPRSFSMAEIENYDVVIGSNIFQNTPCAIGMQTDTNTENPRVGGSIPPLGINKIKVLADLYLVDFFCV